MFSVRLLVHVDASLIDPLKKWPSFQGERIARLVSLDDATMHTGICLTLRDFTVELNVVSMFVKLRGC